MIFCRNRNKHFLILGQFLTLLLSFIPFGTSSWAAGVVSQCNESAFKSALNGGGNVTFSCSGTIVLSSEAFITEDTVIDGAGQNVTLSGGNSTRILRLFSTSANPRSLTVRNLTLSNGRAAPIPGLMAEAYGGAILTEHQGILTLENVTFNNNVADDGGSAIHGWWESLLTIDNCRFNNNIASAGNDERGATISFPSPRPLIIRNSEFINNRGTNGAAVNTIQATLTIENSRFIGNDTLAATVDSGEPNPTLRGFGGAIYTDNGTVVLRNNVFENNHARSAGGAIALHIRANESITIEDNIFMNNEVSSLSGPNGGSGSAGAVYLFGLAENNLGATLNRNLFAGNRSVNDSGALRIQNISATITNATFFDNRATVLPLTPDYNGGIGGAIAIFGASPITISHATFAQNHASWTGGAIIGNSQTNIYNSIFFQNTADNGTNDWGIDQHGNCEPGGSNNLQMPANGNCPGNNVTPGTTTADPMLAALADNGGFSQTMALLPGSPAIDASTNNCAAVDQRDFERPSPCDLGAFEAGVVDGDRIIRDDFED